MASCNRSTRNETGTTKTEQRTPRPDRTEAAAGKMLDSLKALRPRERAAAFSRFLQLAPSLAGLGSDDGKNGNTISVFVTKTMAEIFNQVGLKEYGRAPDFGFTRRGYQVTTDTAHRMIAAAQTAYPVATVRGHKKTIGTFVRHTQTALGILPPAEAPKRSTFGYDGMQPASWADCQWQPRGRA